MSIFTERHQRDDMHALVRDGSTVSAHVIEGKRLGQLDGPHVFFDGNGEILPAGSLEARNNRKIGLFKGRSFKLGPIHSHDPKRRYHILEKMEKKSDAIIKKFRRRVQIFREIRKESRDL